MSANRGLGLMTCILQYQGARDGAVMTALFCLCGPGSNPHINAICGLSLLLVLSFERFLSEYSSKINISKFKFDQGSGRLHGCAISKSLFIYFMYMILPSSLLLEPLQVFCQAPHLLCQPVGFVYLHRTLLSNYKVII